MQSAIVHTSVESSADAGAALGHDIRARLSGSPDAVLLFAAPRFNHAELLASLEDTCRPRVLVGSSSAGEFTRETRGEGLACALALKSSDAVFGSSLGESLSRDPAAAAKQMASGFRGLSEDSLPHRTAIILADALAGYTHQFIDALTLETAGRYQFVGGGAGDNAQFQRTDVFLGTRVLSNAAVALEVLSKKPLGIGVSHGWEPASAPLRVTEVSGARIVGLNGMPAVDSFQQHASATGQKLDPASPIPFFLHNIIGIDTSNGYRLRVPLAIESDGSVICAADVPRDAIICIMRTNTSSAVDAAKRATEDAVRNLKGHQPVVGLFFDCVATRLRMGGEFGLELDAVAKSIGQEFVGCNTHGQIARAPGQFDGFHNCTAVVCVFPE